MKLWKIYVISIVVLSVGALAGLFYYGKHYDNGIATGAKSDSAGSVAGATTEKNDDYLDNLTSSMTEKGMILYCSFESADCKDQKALFADSFKNINYVECDAAGPDANPDECLGQNVSNYPTWGYNGQFYYGVQSLSNLAKTIGFSN